MKEYKTYLPKLSLVKEKSDFKRVKISSSKDAAEYAHKFYGSDIGIVESFFLMLLNNANNTIGYVKISEGGITGTLVDVRVVCHYVLQALATGVILVHNHPSGTLKPSEADNQLTQKIKKAFNLLDVKLLDHIIIVPDDKNYCSFADDNLI
jgi:DNA repair protein RadC